MSGAGLAVRTATPADAALLAEFGARTFSDTFAADNTPEDMAAYLADAFGEKRQASELADPASTFLIVEVGGVPGAYARLLSGPTPGAIAGERPVEVRRFYVEKAWHGRGVAGALMEACLRHAARLGRDTVWLDVWEENPRAVAFYSKWGFAVVGEQDFLLGSDVQHDLLMSRRVAR